jgi:hypothetical protein
MRMTTPSVAVGIAPESECRRSQQEPLVVRLSAQHSNRKRLACATDARNGIDKIRVRVLDRGMCAVPDRAVTRRVRGNRGVPNGCACGPNRLLQDRRYITSCNQFGNSVAGSGAVSRTSAPTS